MAPPQHTYRYPLARVSYGAEEIAAVVETLEAGRTTMGPRVAELERRFAEYVGSKHAVMVNSGSSADLLLAFGLGPATDGRSEILVPAVTWPTQVWACVLAGYTVRLVDCDPTTLQMDMDDLEHKVTERTRAIFPAHILGNYGELYTLSAMTTGNGIALLEDCCEALGTRLDGEHVGTWGDAGAFSFFFSHLLSTMEGGMVVTDWDDWAERCRLWRNHGWQWDTAQRFRFPTWGLNLRPTEVQGAFGLAQMDKLAGFVTAHAQNVQRLEQAVSVAGGGYLSPASIRAGAVLHAYPLLVHEAAPFTRDQLCAHLEQHGIETRPIVAGNLARQPAVAHHPKVIAGPLPGADAIDRQGLYIGLHKEDDPEGCAYVAQTLDDFVRGCA